MLIDLHNLIQKYQLKINGVIHVGAHWAEEHDDYISNGIVKFVYVEPCKEAYSVLIDKFNARDTETSEGYFFIGTFNPNDAKRSTSICVLNFACGVCEEDAVMYVSPNNQGQSNSLLKPNLHLDQHPDVQFTDAELVRVSPLDKLMEEHILPYSPPSISFNMLVMDVQGFEGSVLKGATETLKHIDIIYTECNRGQTYEGNMEIEEMDEYLKRFGFERVETFWPSPNWTWGDAVYLKK
jgi:FkbM family methyltransferase